MENGHQAKNNVKSSCEKTAAEPAKAAAGQQAAATTTTTTENAVTNTGPLGKMTADCVFLFLRATIALYDLISQPVFYFKHRVYEKQHKIEQMAHSQQVNPNDPNSPWRQVNIEQLHKELETDVDAFPNFDKMMRETLKRFAGQPCYGYRQVLQEHWVKRPESDKLLRQVRLSGYKWCTYAQLDKQIEAARRGFILSGIRAGDKVMIYADTRPEWQISSQALIRLGATVATMYATMGVDGIVHSVNETQITHMVTQRDKVNKLLRLKSRLPKMANIIYFDLPLDLPVELGGDARLDSVKPDGDEEEGEGGDTRGSNKLFEVGVEHGKAAQVRCLSFRRLVLRGLRAPDEEIEKLDSLDRDKVQSMDKDSIAVIMYTSGSTGIPKGVLVTHGNVMATTKAFSYVTKDFCRNPKDQICTAYLPLAHIFEFSLESMMLYHGVRFGFATPHTLTDKSPGLMPGERGDFVLLQPTVSIIVPLILDRVVQGVKQVIGSSGYFKSKLVTYLIKYKTYWQKKHYETPLVDKIVCSKIKAALGGRLKYCISGSAPLSPETQTFVRSAMNMYLPQGFGSTETCAAATCQLFEDQTTGNVGVPVAGAFLKLEPWLEGNYRPTDKPNPRGEIVVGGGMVAAGYYKLEQLTREAFYTDEEGTRWYRTGDIGEFLPNGNLKIIDRKKDLVKLQNGEFVSLGRIESSLKSNQFTDNFCIYANSNFNYVVALGPANQIALRKLARQLVDAQENNKSNGNNHSDNHSNNHKSDQSHDQSERNALLTRSHLSPRDTDFALEELKEILEEYAADPDADLQQISNERKMSTLSTHSTANYDERLKRLCDNKLILDYVKNQLTQMAKERNLTSLEIPKKLILLAEDWTEDKNLVTAALKIRRNYIYKRYEQELKLIYQQN